MRYSNLFYQSPQGNTVKICPVTHKPVFVPHPAYIPSQNTHPNEPLFNERRRNENDEKRELGLTGSAYRKLIKRRRRELV